MVSNCILDQRRGIWRAGETVAERSSYFGTPIGVVSTLTLADVVQEGGEQKCVVGAKLDGDPSVVLVVPIDQREHFIDGAPEMSLDRVLMEWGYLRGGPGGIPFWEEVSQDARILESRESNTALLAGTEEGDELIDRWWDPDVGLVGSYTQSLPDHPADPAHWIIRVDQLGPPLAGETIDRSQGRDEHLSCLPDIHA
jgi:hypothetical protein